MTSDWASNIISSPAEAIKVLKCHRPPPPRSVASQHTHQCQTCHRPYPCGISALERAKLVLVIVQLAGSAQRVAVIGIKTADKASQPAHFVPQYLQQQGVKIYPVPVRDDLQHSVAALTLGSA